MTEATLPLDGWRLDPDAVRPPFEWQVNLPTGPAWSLLDTYPATWQRSATRLIDTHLAGRYLRAAQRRAVLGFLDELVAACQQSGTVLSLVYIGALDDATLSTAGLHVAWYDSAPDPASLATARSAASSTGIVEEIDTPAGPLILQHDYRTVMPAGIDRRVGMTSLQAFLPVPESTWTAIVATSSPQSEMVDYLRAIVVGVAGSIRPTTDGPTGADTPTLPEGPSPEGPPMVEHRIEPGALSSRPRP